MFSVTLGETDMTAFGQLLASALVAESGAVVYLDGTLGMGKTTLSQAVIKACGWPGRVKSPTYTLLEPYECDALMLIHMDLYRLSDPEELEFLGLRDYLEDDTVWLIEWPERGADVLPAADVVVHFAEEAAGRLLRFEPNSMKGSAVCERVKLKWGLE